MLKKPLLILACILTFFEIGRSESITLRDTLYLNKGTHISNTLTDWDSVVTWVMRGTSLVERVKLTKYATGEYAGAFKPTYTGDYVATYYAYYSAYKVREEQYFSVLDTSAFMGSAAGLTAREIMDSIEVRGWFAGAGGFACTVYTKLDLDSTPIVGVRIIAKNTTETITLGNVLSNANGWAVLNLDSLAGGAYHHFWLTKSNYDFAFPESADVNVNTKVTFYGSEFDPGTPASADLCRVYGWIYSITGQPISGQKVEAKIDTVPLRYGTVVISPYNKSTTTNSEGYWELDLYPNLILTPATTQYVFYIPRTPTGTILKVEATVPDQESWELQW